MNSCSARSGGSQLSTNLHSCQLLSLSINSSDETFYGSLPCNYMTRANKSKSGRGILVDETTSLILAENGRYGRKAENCHLYDNIGFADSPLFNPPVLSPKIPESVTHQDASETLTRSRGLFRGRFRIFLACYMLIGITLAIYSRNALSLAAVGMVANNVVDEELINILAARKDRNGHLNNETTTGGITGAIQNIDGSCLILDRHLERRQRDASRIQSVVNVMSHLPPGVDFDQAHRYQLEQAFRSSIKQRIQRGQLVDWSPSEQGLIFAAGSVGNLMISIPITRVGEIYGPKWVIFSALSGATMQAALMPLVAPLHIGLVILFQVIFSGLAFGADCVAYTLFAYWLTPTEIAFFVACLVVCYQLGAILSSVITAQILTRALDWSWCFYVPAILCGLWTCVWLFIGASEPGTSLIISKEELDYLAIKSKLSQATKDEEKKRSTPYSSTSGSYSNHNEDEQSKQRRPVAWLKLAKDPNIWAIIAVKFTLRWYFSVNISLMPTYLSSVAHMSVDNIGKFSAVQSILGLMAGILMGYLTKSVVSKRPFNLSLPAFRKIFQSVVNFGLAGSLIVFTTFDCDQWVTITTLTVASICTNFHVAAALQLPLDLSPNYCGLITSITNTLALGQAIGAPISGLILNSASKDRNLWRVVWGIAISLNILSGILFILLVDSKPRDYSKDEEFKVRVSKKLKVRASD